MKKKKIKKSVFGVLLSILLLTNVSRVKADSVPAGSTIRDVGIYNCAVYSFYRTGDKDFTHVFTEEELSSIEYLNCGEMVKREMLNNTTDLSDLSKFPNLKSLTLQDAPGVHSIDLSNYNLSFLNLRNLSVDNVNVSHMTNLSTINLIDLNISAVDLSNKPSLKNVLVRSEGVTSLNITNSPNIEALVLDKTKINSLDISALSSLNRLQMIGTKGLTSLNTSNNPNLTSINISGTTIQALDITNNTNLDYLDISGSNVTSINAPETKPLVNGANVLTTIKTNYSTFGELKTLFRGKLQGGLFPGGDYVDNISDSTAIPTGSVVGMSETGTSFYVIFAGDTTQDGKIDMKDVLQTYNHQRHQTDSTKPLIADVKSQKAADFNSDEKVDMVDVLLIYEEQKSNQ